MKMHIAIKQQRDRKAKEDMDAKKENEIQNIQRTNSNERIALSNGYNASMNAQAIGIEQQSFVSGQVATASHHQYVQHESTNVQYQQVQPQQNGVYQNEQQYQNSEFNHQQQQQPQQYQQFEQVQNSHPAQHVNGNGNTQFTQQSQYELHDQNVQQNGQQIEYGMQNQQQQHYQHQYQQNGQYSDDLNYQNDAPAGYQQEEIANVEIVQETVPEPRKKGTLV